MRNLPSYGPGVPGLFAWLIDANRRARGQAVSPPAAPFGYVCVGSVASPWLPALLVTGMAHCASPARIVDQLCESGSDAMALAGARSSANEVAAGPCRRGIAPPRGLAGTGRYDAGVA